MDTKHASTSTEGRQHGLTLIEAAIVLAITAIVAATAAPSLAAFVDKRRLDGAATALVADIHFARSEATAQRRALRLSVHSSGATSCWVVHTGPAAQCTCANVGPAVCTGGAAEIKTAILPAAERVRIAANVSSILFDPLHGTSTPTGTLRLADTRGRAIHHVVNVMGRVRSCSPGGTVSGYLAC